MAEAAAWLAMPSSLFPSQPSNCRPASGEAFRGVPEGRPGLEATRCAIRVMEAG